MGGPYTLGNDGAVPEIGLEFPPVSPPVVEVVGESGGIMELDSVIFEREYVRSRDWARFVKERGLVSWSLSLASRSESEPRLIASSVCLVRPGIPEPWFRKKKEEVG